MIKYLPGAVRNFLIVPVNLRWIFEAFQIIKTKAVNFSCRLEEPKNGPILDADFLEAKTNLKLTLTLTPFPNTLTLNPNP